MLKLEDIYNVVIAKDGQEAYDIVKESMDNPFNLIFMDVQVSHKENVRFHKNQADLHRCRTSMAFRVLVSFDKWAIRPRSLP